MPTLTDTSSYWSGLRARATTQLTGSGRGGLTRTSTVEAMAVLFKLASSPDTAGDALALLHELQVHQVEVDLQHEELHQSREALENDLARQTGRFEHAPTAMLVLDPAFVVCEINVAGLRLLGGSVDDLLGRPITSLLTVVATERLRHLIAQAGAAVAADTVALECAPLGGVPRMLWACAGREAGTDRFLLVLMEPPATPE